MLGNAKLKIEGVQVAGHVWVVEFIDDGDRLPAAVALDAAGELNQVEAIGMFNLGGRQSTARESRREE